MNYEVIFWFVLLLILLVAELVTLNPTLIWFCIGSLVSLVLAIIGVPIAIQLLAFVIVSAAMLYLTRPFIQRFLSDKHEATNVIDRIIGSTCMVSETINNLENTGYIKFDGKEFRARTLENITVEAGSQVVVEKLEGVTAYVRV